MVVKYTTFAHDKGHCDGRRGTPRLILEMICFVSVSIFLILFELCYKKPGKDAGFTNGCSFVFENMLDCTSVYGTPQ